MKQIFVLTLMILLTSFTVQTNDVEPEGIYKLVSKTKVENGETYGYFGEIQVEKFSADKIIITLEVNKGAPSYNSGSFMDTLIYKDNQAIYTYPESEETCEITFDFEEKGIHVKQETAEPYSSCGFGHNVFADGFYERK